MRLPLAVVASWRRIGPAVGAVAVQAVGLAGVISFIEGIRRIYEPAALMAGGALAVVWTVLKVRQDGRNQP